ncbi:unnamed protein product [Aphanomyces euteiches]|uniref:Temptin Cys/Cys disulfide domain-containing protein n=1 Tax=Aphanomyces euteiches TaxID=100861 RepID=A0A6G0XQN6_9STRA|nr:hypothetical protein Ae201684_002253 [Aphanomyces euteiches]KAH9086663.1 hypothetical protein Ae201684P_000085 [Aphanomyces euteiches]KAH9125021.1 hypothetical protein AeMF1_004300 [Aphanomyces euteiches]KAH9142635.1 hypothetical protein AeRB84_013282 [Aphanomyces euteiches]KAH9161084.1 hypothetical protein LEN26_001584 [Aphanomyces euteiches]
MFIYKLLVLSTAMVAALQSYNSRIPNANNVLGVQAIGHKNPAGGGASNSFGDAFAKAGNKWTTSLCQADTDGDGATNGEELGDPCCVWKVGARLNTTTATHPGVVNTFTPNTLAALKCVTTTSAAGKNGTNASSTPSSSISVPSTTSVAMPFATSALVGSVIVGLMLG